jgi:hypothetical protein
MNGTVTSVQPLTLRQFLLRQKFAEDKVARGSSSCMTSMFSAKLAAVTLLGADFQRENKTIDNERL